MSLKFQNKHCCRYYSFDAEGPTSTNDFKMPLTFYRYKTYFKKL